MRMKMAASRVFMVLTVIVLVLTVSAAAAIILQLKAGGQPESTSQPLWSEWGISVEYPAGSRVVLSPTLPGGPNSTSGQVAFYWNSSFSSLSLVWQKISGFSYDQLSFITYNLTYRKLAGISSEISSLGNGTLMLDNQSWLYVNYKFNFQNRTLYATFAYAYFPLSHRLYGIAVEDNSPDTFALLLEYGSTFRG